MTLKGCWRSLIHGKWTQNRLMSRKFLLVLGTITVAVGLDIAGRALGSDTLGFVRDVVLGFLVVQGAVEFQKSRSGGDL